MSDSSRICHHEQCQMTPESFECSTRLTMGLIKIIVNKMLPPVVGVNTAHAYRRRSPFVHREPVACVRGLSQRHRNTTSPPAPVERAPNTTASYLNVQVAQPPPARVHSPACPTGQGVPPVCPPLYQAAPAHHQPAQHRSGSPRNMIAQNCFASR